MTSDTPVLFPSCDESTARRAKIAWRLALLLLAGLLLAACQSTTYRPVTRHEAPTASPMDRRVDFHVDKELYRDPPDCVVVLPTKGIDDPGLARRIAAAYGRRLAGRVDRVILPQQRRRLARASALDLEHEADLRRFAALQRCAFHARAVNGRMSDSYMVVWSEKRIGFTLSLSRTSDEKALWWASHTARRGDGGLPMSPLSLLGSAAVAGSFHADEEIVDSLIDDALRRMIRTLPDMRLE